MITKEELDMIGEAAQRYGIRTFKFGEMMLVFRPQEPRIMFDEAKLNRPIGQGHGMPTDDQMLFASSIPMTDEEIAARAPE